MRRRKTEMTNIEGKVKGVIILTEAWQNAEGKAKVKGRQKTKAEAKRIIIMAESQTKTN